MIHFVFTQDDAVVVSSMAEMFEYLQVPPSENVIFSKLLLDIH